MGGRGELLCGLAFVSAFILNVINITLCGPFVNGISDCVSILRISS
jgi:hypothetical protein